MDGLFVSPSPRNLAFSPDGSVLAVGLTMRTDSRTTGGVRFLDAATLERKSERRLEYAVVGLTYAPDGKSLFLRGQETFWHGSLAPTTVYWLGRLDLSTGACKQDWDRGALSRYTRGWYTRVCSGDDRATAWMEDEAGPLKVQPLFPEGAPPKLIEVQPREKPGRGIALATEQGPLAYADADNRIHVLDLGTQQELACLSGHEQPVLALLLTADGKRLISAAGDDGGFDKPLEVIVWDVPGRCVHKRLPALSGPFNRFFLSRDGRRLAVGVRAVSESTDLTVWDVESGEKVHTSTYLAYGTPAAFSPDGRRLAVVEYSDEVKILDLSRR
jgi:WD40 repeat protein